MHQTRVLRRQPAVQLDVRPARQRRRGIGQRDHTVLGVRHHARATHDIAADGVYISSLSDKQQAEFSGWQGAAYNVGKLVAQGALVYVAGMVLFYFQ